MKLPINLIARFALKRIVLPAIGRAVANKENPLTAEAAKRALEDAAQAEVLRQIAKRGL